MLQAMALLGRRSFFVPTPQPCRLFLVPTRINSVSPREIAMRTRFCFLFSFFSSFFLFSSR
jgi:hypothetical protein